MLEKINNRQVDPKHLSSFLRSRNCIDDSSVDNCLSFYDIIYVIQNDTNSESNRFKTEYIDQLEINLTLAYTDRQLCEEQIQEGQRIRPITVGMLCRETKSKSIEVVGLNMDKDLGMTNFENFIFVPPFDEITGQYILSPRDEAISLLSIDNESHRFMGVEATFFSITNKGLVTFGSEERQDYLNNLIDNLSFVIPRIPQPKGSANIICLLLNLENSIEERAFVRDYPTFDNYTEVLFVNSELDLLTGNLSTIDYDGASLEGIYLPLIKRAKGRLN
ncbi:MULTISPECIES: hypothetical protein [Halobacteriovorax]|uniref:Uncharacterized protein n=1 Tax=Halobacteriovorax vibrionivorans TaxID=2152716 RepID=A0ABY0IHW4_9BACT|nr:MULTISPECIES: hypothetical protein [Halobacteriovorax]RZF22541.1 hypothetical protein DAY19_01865 [Halobacteriovorax vibrionivorans]TGD47733.1 hypothetical protein EP118_07230 [Halobacteriovorax sp. Y22]